MNWKPILTVVAIATGLYFLWSLLSRAEANPTSQPAFDSPATQPALNSNLVTDPYNESPVSGDIPAINPEESLRYDTVYNILVEAPVIPEIQTQDIMDDLIGDIDAMNNDPLPDATGGEEKTTVAKTTLAKVQTATKTTQQTAVKEMIPTSISELAEENLVTESLHNEQVYVTTSQGSSLIRMSGR